MEDRRLIKSLQEYLIGEMKSGIYRYAEKLPRESKLSEKLSISRTQLRDVLAELEREGFITRRQGVGTLINRHVLDVRLRADLEIEFTDMVRRCGYEARERLCELRTVVNAAASQKLGLEATAELFMVSRIVTANGKPVIYCEDYIAKSQVARQDYSVDELEQPIFHFLKEFCGIEPYMDICELRAVLASGDAARWLDVPTGTPLLFMDELDYDIDGRPILYAPQYYTDGVITNSIIRSKL